MIHRYTKLLRDRRLGVFLVPAVIGTAFLSLYVSQQITSIYGGDSGELVSAAYTWGIAHPGYPLYTLLGAIISHIITVGTVAWRMGFLSSVPMATSVYLVWRIVHRLTKSLPASTAASVLYGLLYPVWLYGITPEVFGIYAMFSALFVYLTILWIEDLHTRTLMLLAFITGLAFTHHHLILLAVVAAAFTAYKYYKKSILALRARAGRFALLFVVGLAPYLYAPIASFFNPPFDREHAATIDGFLRLITRASYGSFRASAGTGGILNGLADVATFGQYVVSDMTLAGVVFACAGLYYLWLKNKRIFSFIALYLLLLFVYFFYAGFPLLIHFHIGTLERFFIVPYQILAILFGVGVAFFTGKFGPTFSFIIYALIFLLPLGALRAHYSQLSGLTNDRTLENYAKDVNASIPFGSIYGAYEDTTASAIDYTHYVTSQRPDIIYVNYYMLGKSYYRQQLHKRHPGLQFPEWHESTVINQYIDAFLAANSKKYAITSDIALPNISGYFIPGGLVYIYYPAMEDIPDRGLILNKNGELWKQFSDPLSGTLGKYKHLLLSDVLRLYADHALALAHVYALSGRYQESKARIFYALDREINVRTERYAPTLDVFMEHGECSGVRDIADRMHIKWGDDFVVLEQYHKIIEKCKQDDPQIQLMESRYKELKPVYDTQIR